MLAYKPTDIAIGLKETSRAYLKERNFPEPDFTFEDLVLQRLSQARSARPA